MGIQVALFKALRSVKIGDHDATCVVDELEGHIAMKIAEANAPLIAELRSLGTSLRWMFGTTMTLSLIAGTIGGYIAFILK
jgi:hypothetical protein